MRWHAVVGALLVAVPLLVYFLFPVNYVHDAQGELIGSVSLNVMMAMCVHNYQTMAVPQQWIFSSPLFESECGWVTPASIVIYLTAFAGCVLIAWAAFKHFLKPKEARIGDYLETV